MRTLQEMFDAALMEFLSEHDSEVPDELTDNFATIILNVSDSMATSILSVIKKDAPSGLKVNSKHQRQFEQRLKRRWRKPLGLLDLFIALAFEAGRDFNDEFREDAARSNDFVFESLTLLHARACQIASAILVLLRSGYADDAHARWRALHEISVVSQFISREGQGTAERYLLHDTVQRYKLARAYQEHAAKLNEEPISTEELEGLQAARDELVERFGKPFRENYGWAALDLGNPHPTIGQIEESVGLQHWRPYYGMASDNVHANAHGAYYRLGSNPVTSGLLLAGASDLGLADPGHSAAISLHQITTVLLATKPDLYGIVIMKILQRLQDEVGEAFLEAHRKLEGTEDPTGPSPRR